MRAADLPATKHYTGTVTWTHNGTTHAVHPFAIEHASGYTFLHYQTGRAHQLKDEWEVEVSP